MKRTIFSMAAIAIAICAAAFTAPTNNKFADSFFEFDYAHYTPTIANVQDEAKWIKVTSLQSCDNQDVRACGVRVASTYVSGSSLLPSANITAMESTPGIAFVTSANAVQIQNKN